MKKTIHILVVEDDPPLNSLLCTYLQEKGFKNVTGFQSTEEMLEKLSRKTPTIIIQDYDLPKMNGIDSIRTVKPDYPNVEFIFLSGQQRIDIAIEALKNGAFDYIVKDHFAKENVFMKIQHLIRYKTLERKRNFFFYSLLISLGFLMIALALLVYFFSRQ
jgi:DNA-binding NtrC family response regulator